MALSALCVVLLYYTTNIDYNMILASAFQFNVGTANLVYISLIVDMFPPNVRWVKGNEPWVKGTRELPVYVQ